MDAYKFFTKILSDRYKPSNQRLLEEPAKQRVWIDYNGIDLRQYALYKFDVNGDDNPFPFFESSDNAHKNLRCFCDYVLVADFQGAIHIILIELKTGDASHAKVQFEAAELFVNFLLRTADRIKRESLDFDFSNHTIIKKVVIKKGPTQKPLTKPSRTIQDLRHIGPNHYIYKTNSFDIAHICRFKP
ncbi:MAG: hypothetical protein LIP09_13680 [Bacteroidales bacterium]|nr:hypothetical protein [Bacteroidales bacterium]